MALEAVQAQAGHISIESTRVYLHLTNDWLANEYRHAAELIDAGHADRAARPGGHQRMSALHAAVEAGSPTPSPSVNGPCSAPPRPQLAPPPWAVI